MQEKVDAMAKDLGFDFATPEGQYGGYSVYVCDCIEPTFIGRPAFILEKDGNLTVPSLEVSEELFNWFMK